MADKSISELVAATAVGSTDLFVLEQTGTAKKLTGQILENWLVSFADGHGGIQSITKTGTSGLVDTYTVLLADTTTYSFTVTNGKAISSITQYWAVSTSDSTVPSTWYTTRQTMTPTNKYLWSYMTITYNDSTTEDTTKSVVGVYGDTGAQTYVWIKYAAIQPTSDADMGDVPDNWIGIYTGLSSTAPTSYTAYAWYEYKGEKGDTGDASTITSQSVTYQEGTSGTIAPSGTWTPTIPTVTAGNFLWTRTILEFNDLSTVTAYSVSRFGIDGAGAVSTVNSISPDTNGNVALTATDIPTSDNISVQEQLDTFADDYLPLTAGASKPLTGALVLKSSNNPLVVQDNTTADISATPSSAQYWSVFHRDKNTENAAYWQTALQTSGIMQTTIAARRKVNGSNVDNALYLRVASDGTKSVDVTSPAAWRSALGLGTSGALPITIAQGGSGQTAVTSTATISNIITAGSGFQIVSAGYYQWGKLAQLYIKAKYVTTTTTTPGYLQIGTLVSGKRPAVAAGAIISDPSIQWGYIGSSGPVYAYGTWQYNTEKDLIATFLLA